MPIDQQFWQFELVQKNVLNLVKYGHCEQTLVIIASPSEGIIPLRLFLE